MSFSLTALEGPGKGTRYPVERLPAYVGSGDSADVILTDAAAASMHARLVMSGKTIFVEDLGTDSQLAVNESRSKRSKLANGDIVEIGDVKLLVQLTAPREDKKSAPKTPDKTGIIRQNSVWAAGFNEDFRRWFEGELAESLGAETRAFRSGEDLLVELSDALYNCTPPSLLILDLKLPIINGINVAIAARAFELGHGVQDHMPLVFLFEPPGSGSFDKVVRFCQPVEVRNPGFTDDDTRAIAREEAEKALS